MRKGSSLLHKLVVVTLLALVAQALAVDLLVYGGRGHREFLGCLNCSDYSSDSVWNEYSRYGFLNDFGVWNPFGDYASPFSSYSMCNEYATDPPVIVDKDGNFYGRLSINPYISGNVCGVGGVEELCTAIKTICKSK